MTSLSCQSRTRPILYSPIPLLVPSRTLPWVALSEALIIFNPHVSSSLLVMLSMLTIRIISAPVLAMIHHARFANNGLC